MPGSQELLLGIGPYHISLKVYPKSRLRHLKLIGPLILFHLGANIRFRVDIQTTKIEPNSIYQTNFDRNHSYPLVIFLNNQPSGTNRIEFEIPDTIGEKVSLITDTYFLQTIGDGDLRLSSGAGAGSACYAFRIWDPALSVINWTVVFLTAIISIVVGWAIGRLTS